MYLTKCLLFTFTLVTFIACDSAKETQDPKDTKENNTTTSIPSILSPKQIIVKKELDNYLKALKAFNTDVIVDMTYPKLFFVIDLDLYRQYIASMMNSTDIEMRLYESNLTNLSAVTTFSNGTEFAQATYTSKVNIHFLNNTLYDTEKKMNFLYDALIHKYGKENIKINTRKRILNIKKEENLLIIKERDSEWKFLGDNSKYRQLYPSFLPHEILKIINKESIERRDINETT